MKKKIISIMMLVVLFGAMAMPKVAYAQEELEIEVIERVNFASVAEFQAFLSENFNIEFSATASGSVQGSILAWVSSDKLHCDINVDASATASKIGAKDIYLRVSDVGSSIYTSQSLGEYSKTNSQYYYSTLTASNPTANKKYQFKATYFAVISGIEYTCAIESNWATY